MHIGTGPRAGHWMHVEPIELFSGTITSDTDGASFEIGDRGVLRLARVVSAAAGETPTLDVTVQGSQDATNWFTLGTFTQATAAGTERKVFPTARFVRVSNNIGGTGDTAGTLSAVVKTGPGPLITASGDPDAAYDFEVEITTTGVEAVGQYRWSLDGGSTWEESTLAIPGTPYTDALGTTGVTITFAATLGTVSAVTKSGAGPNITVAGDPAAAYDVKILISKNGDLNVGEFYYSLDGGDTFDAVDVVIPLSGEYVLGATGLTLTFAAGAYVDGDVYSFTTTAPNPYLDNTTYGFTSTAPVVGGGDSSFTFKVSGETA